MVDGVSPVNAGFTTTEVDGGEKFFNRGVRPQNEVVPVGSSKRDSAKGTSVQTGNPYFQKLPEDYFMELRDSDKNRAIKETSEVRGSLGRLYAKVLKENPYADIDLPPLPEINTSVRKKDRLDTYLAELREYEITAEQVLNDARDVSVVEQVNANTNARAAETQALVAATSSAELAAIYSLREDMFNGLNNIASLIETETHRIIAAVDANGNKIMRAINKATKEIKEFIVEDGDRTRLDAFYNTVGLHQHMDYNTTWLGLKIDDQGQWTREHVSREHNITRQFIHEEHEATRSVADEYRSINVAPPEVPVSPEDGGSMPWWIPFFGPPAPVGAVPYGAPVTTPSSTGSPVTGPTGAPDGDVGSTGYMTPVGKDGETPTETEVEVPKENNSNPPNSGDIGTGVDEEPPKASVFKGIFRADK